MSDHEVYCGVCSEYSGHGVCSSCFERLSDEVSFFRAELDDALERIEKLEAGGGKDDTTQTQE